MIILTAECVQPATTCFAATAGRGERTHVDDAVVELCSRWVGGQVEVVVHLKTIVRQTDGQALVPHLNLHTQQQEERMSGAFDNFTSFSPSACNNSAALLAGGTSLP